MVGLCRFIEKAARIRETLVVMRSVRRFEERESVPTLGAEEIGDLKKQTTNYLETIRSPAMVMRADIDFSRMGAARERGTLREVGFARQGAEPLFEMGGVALLKLITQYSVGIS